MWTWLSQLSPQSILDFFGKIADFVAGFLTSSELRKEKTLKQEAEENAKALQANIDASRLTDDELANSLSKYTLGGGKPTVFGPEGPTNPSNSSST